MDKQDALAKSQIFTVRLGALTPFDTEAGDIDQSKLPVGTIIDQKYEIMALIGEGGMGAVYRAKHELLNKEVALKTFNGHVQSEESQQRFQREAQSLAKLRHRNVVEVFDYGLQKDKTPFYTMEYLIGKSLAEKIAGGRLLSVEQTLPLFIQAASGLAYVHSKGLVHRDLKPGNIFIERNGNVKIVDFGIVSTIAEQNEDQRLTRTADGIIMGSPLYMSPEQARGLATGPASDVYSYGCALYECLTGRPPFVGANALITILMHQDQKAPSLAEATGGDFSPQLELVVARLLAKKPEARFRDFEAVESSLKRCLDTGFAAPERLPFSNRKDREDVEDDGHNKSDSATRLKYIGLGAALTIAAALLVSFLVWRPQPQAAPVKLANMESQIKDPKTGEIIGPLTSFVEPPTVTPPLPKFPIEAVQDQHGESLVRVSFPTEKKIGTYRFQLIDFKSIPARGMCSWPSKANAIFTPDTEFAQNPVNFDLLPALNLGGLDLRHTDPMSINGEVMSRIAKLQTLKQLWLPKGSLSAADLKYFDKLPLLRYLSLELTGITSDDLANWPNLNRMLNLNLSHMRKPEPVIERLKKDNKIYSLYLEHVLLTEENYKELASIKSLRHLVLADSNLNNNNLKILAEKTPGLSALSSKECTVSSTLLPILQKMQAKGLTRLEMCSTKFTQSDCAKIQRSLAGVDCSISPLDQEEDIKDSVVKSFDQHVFSQ